MQDINKNNILYIPKVEPKRHYESEGKFKDKQLDIIEQKHTEEPQKDIVSDLEEVKELFTYLPKELLFLTDSIDKIIERQKIAEKLPDSNEQQNNQQHESNKKPISPNIIPDLIPPEELNPVKPNTPEELKPQVPDIIPDIIPDKIPPKEDKPIEPETSIDTGGDELIDLPEFFPGPTNVSINFIPPKTLIQIAQDDFKRDTLDLNEYYLQKLQVVLQQYFQEMLTIAHECGIIDIRDLIRHFDGDAVQVQDGNLVHLKDYIIRSQIARDQRTRLFKLTHDVDNTLSHIRSWNTAQQSRERYYSEKYGNSGTFLDSASNSLLVNSRADHDSKYRQALYDTFKYLDSSVIVTGEILQMITKESQAKGKLIKEGVNIFVSKETQKQEELNKKAQDIEDQANKKAQENKEKDNKTNNNSNKDNNSNNKNESNNINTQQDKADTNTNTNTDTNANQTSAQQQYNDFAKMQKEHPEWFVGDTYVGNDTDARKKAEEALKQSNNKTEMSNKEVNNVLDIVSATNQNSLLGSFLDIIKIQNNNRKEH